MYSLPLCPSMIEKYPLSWFVYSLGSLYALASSQSAAAAGEKGINHRDTEAQRRHERDQTTDLARSRLYQRVPPLRVLFSVVSHVRHRLMTFGIGPSACGQSVGW